MTKLLTCKDLELYYDHVHALKGVSLEIEEGETVALIGANGAGKSSILRAITGLKRIWSGEILYQGQRIDDRQPDDIVKMGIVMVPEGRRVFPYMSVKDNLLMGAFTRTDRSGIGKSLDMVLNRFPRLKERYSAKPRLLLLDEPSLGIAPKLVQDIARSIVAINRDERVSVLLVEQNSRMALRISQRAYALTTGRIALAGQSVEMLNDERVRHLYLGGEL
jgi:branched-chain amino acid transport system ATP-binding protein